MSGKKWAGLATAACLSAVLGGWGHATGGGRPAVRKAMRGNVDPGASDKERVRALWGTIGQVVDDLDAAGRPNKKKFLLHVAWHEGARLTKRVQDAGGPARSFYQMERAKAIDAVDYAKAKGWVGKLANAAGGTTEKQILDAWGELKQGPTSPYFPKNNLIEEKLRTNDLFGTYMARIVLLRIPAAIGPTNHDHAVYWADHWKVKFASPAERAKLIARFEKEADEVDKLVP